MNHIQKISSYLIIFFNVLLYFLPLATVLLWLFVDTPTIQHFTAQGFLFAPIHTPEGMLSVNQILWTPLTKGIASVSFLVEQIPFLLGLFVLKSIFKNYQKGAIFRPENAVSFKQLGWLFLAQACIAKPLSDMLLVGAATYTNAPGHRYLSIGFGTINLESIFCGVMMIVISWVMLEANKLHDEQSFTI